MKVKINVSLNKLLLMETKIRIGIETCCINYCKWELEYVITGSGSRYPAISKKKKLLIYF